MDPSQQAEMARQIMKVYMAMLPVIAILTVFGVVVQWKVFTKAGQPGWACLIPIYGAVVLCRVANKPGWWVLLFLIPLVNIVIAIMVMIGLAEAFGKGGGFIVGLLFLNPIFMAILAFGDAQHRKLGPASAGVQPALT